MTWQHHREHDHSGTEDCSAVELTVPVGRYAAGTVLCDVLDDMIARLAQVEQDYAFGFFSVSLDAYIAPYDPQGSLNGLIPVDAVIRAAGTGTMGLDAVLEAPVIQEVTGQFGIGSVLIPLFNDAITVLTQAVDTGDTVIHVDSSAGFPSVPFVIQIGTETMTVVSVSGTQWTVVRNDPQAHALGSYVVVC